MDLKTIEGLVKIIEESSLTEFTYKDESVKITMSKLDHPPVVVTGAAATAAPAASAPTVPAAEVGDAKDTEEETVFITSPIVGTFYSAAAPDVPVFVRGHAAFAEGVGEILTPVDPPEKWYLVAHPGVSIPTPVIFKDPELPRNTPKRSIETLLKCEFSNDCEVIARKRFREVDAVLSWLLEYAPSRLTGTGACVFAEFDTESEARQVLEQAPEWLNGFVAKGANLSPLHRAML